MPTMNGLRKGDPHRSYEYLLGQLRKYIERQRHEQNRTELERARKVWLPTAMPAASSPSSNRSCRFHAKGHCKFGNECRFLHVTTAMAASTQPKANGGAHSTAKPRGRSLERKRPDKGSRSATPARAPPADAAARPCWAFQRGECTKGAACPYAHRSLTTEEQKQFKSRSPSPKEVDERVPDGIQPKAGPSLPQLCKGRQLLLWGEVPVRSRSRRQSHEETQISGGRWVPQNPPLDKSLVASLAPRPQQSG